MISNILFRLGVQANFGNSCLATHAFHVERGMMIRNTPIHVKLEVASSALKMAIQRMPSFPGQFGDDIDLRDPGLFSNDGPDI